MPLLRAQGREQNELTRPVYVLQVRAEPGVDATRALRAWLKIGLRMFGLRCLEVQESERQGRLKMGIDMRKYSAGVVMPEDLRDGPRVEKIVKISEKETERYTCGVLEFESGDFVYLWNNQARILNKAWGYDSAGWLEQELELSLGHFIDKKTNTEKETIDMRPISPRKTGNGAAPPASSTPSKPSSSGGPVSLRSAVDDDSIPFAPEWR